MESQGKDPGAPDMPGIEPNGGQMASAKKTRFVLLDALLVWSIVAAVVVVVSILFLPVYQVTSDGMYPTIREGDFVVVGKGGGVEPGRIYGFYSDNKLLLKRVIATEGDWVEIDSGGKVYVNGSPLNEPYVLEKSRGNCDLLFPYQVPDGCVFALGDQRAASLDSRNSAIGSVPEDRLVGKVLFRIWPLQSFGTVR